MSIRIVAYSWLAGLFFGLPVWVQAVPVETPRAAEASSRLHDIQVATKRASLELNRELRTSHLKPPAKFTESVGRNRYAEAVRDLDREDYLDTITALESGAFGGEIDARQASLFRVWLLAAYGLPRAAESVLDQSPASEASAEARGDALLQVAEAYYGQGAYRDTTRVLRRVRNEIPEEPLPDNLVLQAQAAMASGRFEAAAQILSNLAAAGEARGYARYNLAVALFRAGRPAEGAVELERLGRVNAGDDEALALRDRANVALGFRLVEQGRAREAEAVFERVRADGPFSREALLGLGWAEWRQQNWRRSLVPWSKLQQLNPADESVVEAWAMIPEALIELGSYARAVDQYRETIRVLSQQVQLVDEALAYYRSDGAMSLLLDAARPALQISGWVWDGADRLPSAMYLTGLLSSDRFQMLLAGFHDLRVIESELASASVPAGLQPDRARAVQERIRALRSDVRQALDIHRRFVRDAVTGVLDERREWLHDYLIRVRHGLARVLDEMAHREDGGD